MPVTLPRYVAVTLTVTPTGSRSYGVCCALVSSGTPDRRLPTRARFTATVTHHCHARRYAHVTPTTTGGGRAYLLRRRAGRSGDADDAAPEKVATASPLPGRPRLVERVAHHTSPSQDATYVTPRLLHARPATERRAFTGRSLAMPRMLRARPATESRALRYRPLAGDATHVTRTTGD